MWVDGGMLEGAGPAPVVLALLTARAYQAVRTLRLRALARTRGEAKRGGGEAAVSLSDAGGAVDI